MGKSINKQAELRRKLELAKQQKLQQQASTTSSSSSSSSQSTTNTAKQQQEQQQILSDEEIKQRNDRKRFEELLQKSSAASAVWNDYAVSDDDYRNQDQVQEDIDAARRGVERLFEGDAAPVDCFVNLVAPQTCEALGRAGMERLVPWLGKNDNDDDYLVILCDPRPTSPDLHTAVRHVWTDCTEDNIRQRFIVINADRPSQNRKWFKKQGWTFNSANGGPTVYCDEKMEWMRAYTALGDHRWSMTLFVLAAGRVQKLVRDVDVYTVSAVVPKAIAAYKQAKL